MDPSGGWKASLRSPVVMSCPVIWGKTNFLLYVCEDVLLFGGSSLPIRNGPVDLLWSAGFDFSFLFFFRKKKIVIISKNTRRGNVKKSKSVANFGIREGIVAFLARDLIFLRKENGSFFGIVGSILGFLIGGNQRFWLHLEKAAEFWKFWWRRADYNEGSGCCVASIIR